MLVVPALGDLVITTTAHSLSTSARHLWQELSMHCLLEPGKKVPPL